MAQLVIAKAEESLPTSDFRLPTSDLAITPYVPYVANFSPTSDFWLSTSNFGLQSFHHFPFPSSKWACFLLLERRHWFSWKSSQSWRLTQTHLAIEIYWTSGESSTYQILPCAASQKQLPLLKESGQQLSFLGHVLRVPDNKPVREFVMYRFQLRGGGNPKDSEPCSPVVYLLSSGGSWYPVKWQSAVANGSRPPSMEEKLVVDCSSAEGWWWWTSK